MCFAGACGCRGLFVREFSFCDVVFEVRGESTSSIADHLLLFRLELPCLGRICVWRDEWC